MHAMSELAVNVLASSRREGDREVDGRSRTGSDRALLRRSRPRARTANLFRRRRRGCCAVAPAAGHVPPLPPPLLLRLQRRLEA